ncbi:MAG: hypothetical protein COB50_04370 [Thiotrichales bacterium]|nr:MAG: hypothetical protein COB50_04370 [Thiotrichales bacterium]
MHNGSDAPSYKVAVSDGRLITIPQAATIKFTPKAKAKVKPETSSMPFIIGGGSILIVCSSIVAYAWHTKKTKNQANKSAIDKKNIKNDNKKTPSNTIIKSLQIEGLVKNIRKPEQHLLIDVEQNDRDEIKVKQEVKQNIEQKVKHEELQHEEVISQQPVVLQQNSDIILEIDQQVDVEQPVANISNIEKIFADNKNLRIDYDSLNFGKKLGQGGFGVVHKAKLDKHQDVAVKRLLVNYLNDISVQNFLTETKVWYTISKDNKNTRVVKLMGICVAPSPYCMVMEYMPYGDLYNILHGKATVSWKVRLQWAKDIGVGLKYLHKNKIVHRDLKSPNILIDAGKHAKIADFGLSETKEYVSLHSNQHSSIAGSTRWMAPELHDSGSKYYELGCTKQTDIYSYGIVLWELATCKLPFYHAKTNRQAISAITFGKNETIPADTPKQLKKTIELCWAYNPKKRPTISEALDILTIEEIKENNESIVVGKLHKDKISMISQSIKQQPAKKVKILDMYDKEIKQVIKSDSSAEQKKSSEKAVLLSSRIRTPSRNKTAKAIEKLLDLAYPLNECDAEELEYRNLVLNDIEPYRCKKNLDNIGVAVLNEIRANLEKILREDGVKYDAQYRLVS